ncbi:hypothetical protein ACJ72_04231 [Emergomyces africanus]|uniref:UDP-glucose:glycoprotein glucosyltransferase n=1 Tax=Emergomyces africanus TaxID=1955775 RepID=A0A1B7NXD4_9EURO|nr:hypothetical protein ACJ72_04231 [Emergomyces africanus]
MSLPRFPESRKTYSKLIEISRETAAEENSTSYFPLLDRIAEGTFAEITTERELYERFTQALQDDGHLSSPESISSFKFALSLRSTTPRIEAHYQYYNTSVEPSLMVAQDAVCTVWAHYDGDQYCSPSLEYAQQSVSGDQLDQVMPFDRVLGGSSLPPLVLYADIASPLFGGFHQELIQKARDGQFSYRVRYRPSGSGNSRPLFVTGYGVELALKRTDYIVIDDRDAEQRVLKDADTEKPILTPAEDLTEEPPADLKPLSASEVSVLGMNAASFVMSSDDPFATLLRLSQDFPRHSSAIASRNATPEFTKEFTENRAALLPAGHNVMWINGVEMEPRTIDAFSLLDHFRRERKLINGLRDFGLSARQAVNFLCDPTIAKLHATHDALRYDFRDELEGGDIIIWLNDLEKDHRYDGWPRDLKSLLQPTFHGQLPHVRRDIHNVIIPVDLSSPVHVAIVVENLRMFVKRQIPVRFGIVPLVHNSNALEQAKISHYLLDTYGIAALIAYLQTSLSSDKISSPDKVSFTAALEKHKVREDRTALAFEDVLKSESYDPILSNTKAYLKRLAVEGELTPFFVNGISFPLDENFLQSMIVTISKDSDNIRQLVSEGTLEEDIWVPSHFLKGALRTRNPLLIPQDPSKIRIVDLQEIHVKHNEVFDSILRIPAAAKSEHPLLDWSSIILITDLDTDAGAKQLGYLLELHEKHPGVEILLLHNGESTPTSTSLSTKLYSARNGRDLDPAVVVAALASGNDESGSDPAAASAYWNTVKSLVREVGFGASETGMVVNSRMLGPMSSPTVFDTQELEQLHEYEHSNRIGVLAKRAFELGLESQIPHPLSLAKLQAFISLSVASDAPEGLYDSGPSLRTNEFEKWSSKHSAISVSNSEDPSIYIVAAIDPTTEIAQRWVPILKVLSELSGVSLKLFLNPRKRIKELPIKRFYRHVLEAAPSFNKDARLRNLEPSSMESPVTRC